MKVRKLNYVFYSLFLLTCLFLYLILTKRGIETSDNKETFVPISNFDDERKDANAFPIIECVAGDNNINVTWGAVTKNIKHYLLVVYDIRNPKNGFKLKTTNEPGCGQVPSGAERASDGCKETIDGLRNGEPYGVQLVMFYKKPVTGKKYISGNVITVVPNGPVDEEQISSMLLKSNNAIDKEVANSIDFDTPCSFHRDLTNSYHSLDRDYESLGSFVDSM